MTEARQVGDSWVDWTNEEAAAACDRQQAEEWVALCESASLMRVRVRAFLTALSRTPMPVTLLEERKALLEALGE